MLNSYYTNTTITELTLGKMYLYVTAVHNLKRMLIPEDAQDSRPFWTYCRLYYTPLFLSAATT